MSEYRTPEEDTITEAEAQQYPGHDDPDDERERAGLDPESGDKADGAPMKREGHSTENEG